MSATKSEAYIQNFNNPTTETLIKNNLPPKWILTLIGTSLLVVAVSASVIIGMDLSVTTNATTTAAPTTTTRQGLNYIGKSCSSSSECISSAYCESSSNLCTCSPQLYYDSSSGACVSRKTYGKTCSQSSECEYNSFLTCSNGVCTCDTMMFWNPYTTQCEDKRGLGETCIGITGECFASNMICSTLSESTQTRCICPIDTHYFSFVTGNCELRKVYGATCIVNFECMDYGWCSVFPNDNSNLRCQCIPNYYWDSSASQCFLKKGYKSSCTYNYECLDYALTLTCISNKCDCASNLAWNGTHCDYLKSYGAQCTKTSDCLNTNAVCSWLSEQSNYACICPNGYYFSIITSSCTPYKPLNAICTDSYECPINASCVLQTGSSDKKCVCVATQYYQTTSNTCQLLKNYGDNCNSSSECQSNFGLTCTNGLCKCFPNAFYNGNRCENKIGISSSSYGKYCSYSSECKDSLGLNNCIKAECTCSNPKIWNGANCV